MVFGKVTYGPFGVFVRVFNSVQLSYQERQDSQLSGEKNRTKIACLVQILQIFISKKHFFGQKKLRTVMRTVKKFKMYLLIAQERKEISQKFQRIWIQQAKTIYSMQKNS